VIAGKTGVSYGSKMRTLSPQEFAVLVGTPRFAEWTARMQEHTL
jgi:hypothetical protein